MSTDPIRVESGRPPVEETVALLDEAYDGWGGPGEFQWLCDQPDPVYHWRVTDDDGLVGYESAVGRTLVSRDGRELSTVLRGNAAVAPRRAGEGVWSAIVDAIDRRIDDEGVDVSVKYVNTDYKTFGVARRDGYSWRRLPLYVRVLSPSRAIESYAGDVLESDEDGDDAIGRLADRVLPHVRFWLRDGVLEGASLRDSSERAGGPTVGVPLSDAMVAALIEAASADLDGRETARAAVRGLVNRFAETAGSVLAGSDPSRERLTAYRQPRVDDADVARLLDLYETVHAGYEFHFRREERDVRHMLSHPDAATTVWVERDGDLVGFAALRWDPGADVKELRVDDALATDEVAFDRLAEAIEAVGEDRGADVICMLAARSPGSRWARVRTQAVVWNPFHGPDELHERLLRARWRLGFYDVE